jgi:hypothetical protein
MKTNSMGIFMSESTSPIDRAWSVVEESSVNKALPLIPIAIGAGMAGLGAAQGSGYRLINPETGRIDPGFHDEAGLYDPLTGGYLYQDSTDVIGLDDESVEGRIAGGAVGALQGINPVAALKLGGTALQAGGRLYRIPAGGGRVLGPSGRVQLGGALRNLGNSKFLGRLGRASQLAGNLNTQFGPQITTLLGAAAADKFLPDAPNMDSYGGSGSTFGLGQTNAGMGDISNVQSSSVLDREIWNPSEGSAFEQQAEYGGTRKSLGEYMFTNNIGEEIKKQVEDMMYKARCAGCAKPECIGKMTCPYGMNEEMSKAGCTTKGELEMVEHEGKKVPKFAADGEGEDDLNKKEGSKKPAHGMVIVIGSKAGPGPSKNGKREKLDSEKKED